MKLISFQWSKWVLLEYSHSEDVSVDTVSSLSYLWYNTYTETHFRNLARTCKRSLFPVVRCPPVRFLSRHYLRWDNDIVYPWGKRFEMEREVLWLWDNLGGLLPRLQYSSCSHPLVSFGFITMWDREVSLKRTSPCFNIWGITFKSCTCRFSLLTAHQMGAVMVPR